MAKKPKKAAPQAKTDKEKAADLMKKVANLVHTKDVKFKIQAESGLCEPGCIEVVIGSEIICIC